MTDKIKEDIKKETVKKIQEVSKKWFEENFDDIFLEQMEDADLIANAEGYKTSMIADLMVDIEIAIFGDIIS